MVSCFFLCPDADCSRINLIRSRTKIEITLANGKKLPISEERQKYFNQQYSHLLGGEINV
ncbi:MAG: hypothetical protein ACLTOK_17500, partial [Anaerobutyricum soehngenii]